MSITLNIDASLGVAKFFLRRIRERGERSVITVEYTKSLRLSPERPPDEKYASLVRELSRGLEISVPHASALLEIVYSGDYG